MKNLFISILLCLLFLAGFSQTTVTTQSYTLTYTGYLNGSYTGTIENKLGCDLSMWVSWNSLHQDSLIVIPKHSTITVTAKANYIGGSKIVCQAPENCGNSNVTSFFVVVPTLSLLATSDKKPVKKREVERQYIIVDSAGSYIKTVSATNILRAGAGLPRGVYIAIVGSEKRKFIVL